MFVIALAALAAAVYSLQPRHVVIIISGPA
jgi:hypothetical protein